MAPGRLFRSLGILRLSQNVRAFLFGLLLVGLLIGIVAALAAPLPARIDDEARIEAEASGAARGRYFAARNAEQTANDLAPDRAEEEIRRRLAEGDPDEIYERAYRYAWNDAVDTLSRRVPAQLLEREDHTQWIELLR